MAFTYNSYESSYLHVHTYMYVSDRSYVRMTDQRTVNLPLFIMYARTKWYDNDTHLCNFVQVYSHHPNC